MNVLSARLNSKFSQFYFFLLVLAVVVAADRRANWGIEKTTHHPITGVHRFADEGSSRGASDIFE